MFLNKNVFLCYDQKFKVGNFSQKFVTFKRSDEVKDEK